MGKKMKLRSPCLSLFDSSPGFIWDQEEKMKKKRARGASERNKREKKDYRRRKLVLLHFIPAQFPFLSFSLLFSLFFCCSFSLFVLFIHSHYLLLLLLFAIAIAHHFHPSPFSVLATLSSPSLPLATRHFLIFAFRSLCSPSPHLIPPSFLLPSPP